jgi:hypothetical protein
MPLRSIQCCMARAFAQVGKQCGLRRCGGSIPTLDFENDVEAYRDLYAAALVGWAVVSAYAQGYQCTTYQGRTICCTRNGNYTYCN